MHVAASSLSGSADTALLASLQRAADADAFPTFVSAQSGSEPSPLDLLVSSVEPAVGTTAAILGQLEVPVWRLSRAAELIPDSPTGGVGATGGDTITVETVVDAQGQAVSGTVRILRGTDGGRDSSNREYRLRLAQRLNELRFAPARIGSCAVPQLVVQSVAVAP